MVAQAAVHVRDISRRPDGRRGGSGAMGRRSSVRGGARDRSRFFESAVKRYFRNEMSAAVSIIRIGTHGRARMISRRACVQHNTVRLCLENSLLHSLVTTVGVVSKTFDFL